MIYEKTLIWITLMVFAFLLGLLLYHFLLKRKIKPFSNFWVNSQMILVIISFIVIQGIYDTFFGEGFNLLSLIIPIVFIVIIFITYKIILKIVFSK